MRLIKENDYIQAISGTKVMNVRERHLSFSGPCTVFGMSLVHPTYVDNRRVEPWDFFEFAIEEGAYAVSVRGHAMLIEVPDYIGHRYMQGAVALDQGHVKYINDCTDSLLICPPRLGEPCLNALYFPDQVQQDFHTHNSLRAGMVISGEGWAHTGSYGGKAETHLREGSVFLIGAGELHRFVTGELPMTVVAYHPDSDWGPTDEVHPMKNRTILEHANGTV